MTAACGAAGTPGDSSLWPTWQADHLQAGPPQSLGLDLLARPQGRLDLCCAWVQETLPGAAWDFCPLCTHRAALRKQQPALSVSALSVQHISDAQQHDSSSGQNAAPGIAVTPHTDIANAGRSAARCKLKQADWLAGIATQDSWVSMLAAV